MKKFENGIVIGRISGRDYVSKDNGDGTHTIVCAIGDVPEIKRSHDQLKQENKQLIETGHKANKDLRDEVEQLTHENEALKADREKAISLMEKGWRHNADDYPNILSRFVGMANAQFEKHEKLKAENKELKSALNEIVFKDSKGVWYTSLSEDSDISGIIKNLLD